MNDMSQASEGRSLVEQPKPKREVLIVDSHIPMLDTAHFEHMGRVAKVIASSSLLPDHLKGESPEQSTGNCFLIVNQSVRWNMDPFALVSGSYIVHGNLGFEGKVIAAAINSDPNMASRLTYEYSGQEGSDDRSVIISGTLKGEGKARAIKGSVRDWKTSNDGWKTPSGMDRMLNYRGSREWARMHNPDRLLGVYSIDELETMRAENAKDVPHRRMRNVTPDKEEASEPPTEASEPPTEPAKPPTEAAKPPTEAAKEPEVIEPEPERNDFPGDVQTKTWQKVATAMEEKIDTFDGPDGLDDLNKWVEIAGPKFDWIAKQDKTAGAELDARVMDKINLLKGEPE